MTDYSDQLIAALKRNTPYVRPGQQGYQTDLTVAEPGFRSWVDKNKVPFNPDELGASDYDMRGFYHALMTADPKAISSINQNDKRLHYPDYWKTPYHQSFSGESQWATDVAPKWNEQDQLVSPGGRILVDERNRYPNFGTELMSLSKGY
jgi:hypothetical protein